MSFQPIKLQSTADRSWTCDYRELAVNLPVETFNQMLASIAVLGEAAPRESERRAPRVKLSTQIEMVPWEEPDAGVNVRVHDLSLGGIGIFHNTRIPLDEQLVVRLPTGNGQSSLWLVDVIYWEPLAEDLFAIGAKFDRAISEAELVSRRAEVSKRANGVLARIGHALSWTMRKAS